MSPSVLMPIFDFVSKEKAKKKENANITFTDWKSNSLKIN